MARFSLRERRLLGVLVVVAAVAVIGVGARQFVGAGLGEPCADSYSCRGFLVGGAECVDVGSGAYCTRYCDSDARCVAGWHCLSANPTALHIETRAVGKVCVRDP